MTQLVVIDVRNPASWLLHKFADRKHLATSGMDIDPDLVPALVREVIENFRQLVSPAAPN